MGIFNIFGNKKNEEDLSLNEANKIFAKRDTNATSLKDLKRRYGEGVEDFSQLTSGFGLYGSNEILGFNSFYKKYLDSSFKNEAEKLTEYRNIARYTEVSEVLEDIVYESTQRDTNGDLLKLHIVDSELEGNENIVKNLYNEFENLFYKRIDIAKKIDELLYTYYVDGKVFFEIVVDESKPKSGVQNIKKLPTETMDFSWNPVSGKYNFFVQYFKAQGKLPKSIEDGMKKEDLVVFYPKQIGYIEYGKYGFGGKKDIIGYLENARQPYNQLKLLETSIVIYRLVRAPERLVFKIDTGNMPLTKAMKFTEQMKQKLQKKVSYDPSTGKMTNSPNVLSMLENFFIPTSSDGRGSSIESIGGNPSGFSELEDLYYFQRKLYRALKYPLSRIESINEKQSSNVLFSQGSGDIARDETKWGRFLKKSQDKFCDAFLDLFLTHLDFVGLSTEYNITKAKLNITLRPPNNYIQQMQQNEINQMWDNYSKTDHPEISKYWRMKKYLNMTDDEIRENAEGLKKDVELGLTPSDDSGY